MLKLALGIDQLLQNPGAYLNKKIALVCNEASLSSLQINSRLALIEKGFNIVKLFAPEHGIESVGEDGKFMPNGIDKLTQLPIVSLYGNKLKPSVDDLKDVDLVLIDLPDIGCRFYTYLWTMSYVLEACAENNTPVLLTDRPNAIGGNLSNAEGPMLDEEHCSSFIGRWNIPLKHACTMGELALFFKSEKFRNLNLTIIQLQGWNRNEEDSFPFNPTSPAMQNRETAYIYPGTGLLEGINVNEGRGTNKPFQQIGAPYINAEEMYQATQKLNIPHLEIKPIIYIPTEGFYTGETCNGLSFKVTNHLKFKAVEFGIALIKTIYKLYPESFNERFYCTVANPSGKGHLDKLLGVYNAIEAIKKDEPFNTDVSEKWINTMKPHLLY